MKLRLPSRTPWSLCSRRLTVKCSSSMVAQPSTCKHKLADPSEQTAFLQWLWGAFPLQEYKLYNLENPMPSSEESHHASPCDIYPRGNQRTRERSRSADQPFARAVVLQAVLSAREDAAAESKVQGGAKDLLAFTPASASSRLCLSPGRESHVARQFDRAVQAGRSRWLCLERLRDGPRELRDCYLADPV